MSTITKEQAKDLRNAFNCWQQDYDPVEDKEQYDMFGLGMVAMDALLSSLEAEPVAFRSKLQPPTAIGSEHWDYTDHRQPDAFELENCVIEHLYTAPLAPVSVPDAYVRDGRGRMMLNGRQEPRIGYSAGWNACRAAMLRGAEPVTTANKLQDDFDFDRFNDVVWLEAVASNPHMHSPITSTIAMVALELNRKLADGNSPDGWVACSDRMPETMISVLVTGDWFHHAVSFWDGASWCDLDFEPPVTHWMPLPAAPQQELK